MVSVHWSTIFITFITTITAYFAMMKIFDFDFTTKSWYAKTEIVLWIIAIIAWIVNACILKNALPSDIEVGEQLLIQMVLNAIFSVLPLAIFAFYVRVRLHIISRKEKLYK